MQIQKIHIENFGKLHDLDMELNSGLNVICASNGWGKTTLAAFLKAMLYGLDYTAKRSLKENERKKYTPWQGGAFGGSMEFAVAEKCYRAERFFGAKDREDTFVLYDLDTGLESQDYTERLGEELFRLDRAAFERSSFFIQQDFAASINDSLNARLSHVEEDAGDMQNYEKAVASLEDRMKYYQKTGNRGQLGKLEEERRQVREQLIECRRQEEAIHAWTQKLKEKEEAAAGLERQQEELAGQLSKVQAYDVKAERRGRLMELYQRMRREEEQAHETRQNLLKYKDCLSEQELDQIKSDMLSVRVDEKFHIRRYVPDSASDRKKEHDRQKENFPKGGKGFWILAAVVLVISMFLMMREPIAGVVGIVSAILFFGVALKEDRHAKRMLKDWEAKNEEILKDIAEEEKMHAEELREKEALKKKVYQKLGMPENKSFSEMDSYYRKEREKNRKYHGYENLLESQEKDALEAQKAYLEYRSLFTNEELLELQHLQKPELERESIQERLNELRMEKEASLRQQQDIRNRIRLLKESAEQIPELEEEEERISQELVYGTREHDLLEKTLKYLKTARDQFSTRYLKGLQQGLEHYLGELEPSYESQPAMDVKLKVKIREAGATRDLEYFSAGWQDMIQIAKRLAIVDALYEGEQPVLILDDPFVNLDTEKEKRAKELLQKLSGKWQMIYFTCR